MGYPDQAVEAAAEESDFNNSLKYVYNIRLPDTNHISPPAFPTLLRAMVNQTQYQIRVS